MTPHARLATCLAMIGALAGCALPQGAGRERQILKGAGAPEASFAVHPVTRATLPDLAAWPQTGAPATAGWITATTGVAEQRIEPGDTLDLTIWDNEESSLLSASGQKVVQLPGVAVSSAGTVFLPYADEVYVAKMSPDAARLAIQQKLITIVPSAQVQLHVASGRRNAVDLVSGVRSPGNYPMPDRSLTILGLIALGGGVGEAVPNPQVRLMRGGKLYGVSMDRLLKTPGFDTTLRGGDKVYVETEARYFLSLGAAGREAQIAFPQDRVTALDAMSLAGGLNDARANPKGILVLRDYDAGQVRTDGTGPDRERVVFAIDLTTADGLFSAGEFGIQNRDLVLVTESAVTTTNTIFSLLGRAIGLGNQFDAL